MGRRVRVSVCSLEYGKLFTHLHLIRAVVYPRQRGIVAHSHDRTLTQYKAQVKKAGQGAEYVIR